MHVGWMVRVDGLQLMRHGRVAWGETINNDWIRLIESDVCFARLLYILPLIRVSSRLAER